MAKIIVSSSRLDSKILDDIIVEQSVNTISYVPYTHKVSENVEVSGISQKEQYVEKVEESTGYGVKYSYNCYVLLELAKTDYLEARRRTLEGAVAQVRQAQNKKAEETLNEVQQKLSQ